MIVLKTQATLRGAYGNIVTDLGNGSFSINPFTPESLLAFLSQFKTIRCEIDESGIIIHALGDNRGLAERDTGAV